MRAPDFTIGQGDSDVVWSTPIFDSNRNPVDLTQVGTTVALHYRLENESADAVDVSGIVVGTTPPAEAGYRFQGSDTTTPGRYAAQWIVTLPGGEVISYPESIGEEFQIFEVLARK